MQLIHLRTLVLLGLFGGCQQTGQTTVPATTSLPGTTTAVSTTVSSSTAPATDPVPWVKYIVNDLASDTLLFAQPSRVGTITDGTLVEASGLAPSRRNPGYLWTEEDSGNPNEIQLLSKDGTVVARFTIDGSVNRDWEDMAVGPGPVAGETYIYVADIGDNKLRYPEKVIYRFPEPAIAGQKLPFVGHVTNADVIKLQLPDGPQNAEAILIDPGTKDLYILSKGDRSEAYVATYPQSLTQTTMMTSLLLMPFDKVTSAGISADGSEVMIRTYSQLFYYKRQPGESITDLLKRAPRLLPLASEPQGEAVGWAVDGTGYYTTSEKPDATPQAIYYYARKK